MRRRRYEVWKALTRRTQRELMRLYPGMIIRIPKDPPKSIELIVPREYEILRSVHLTDLQAIRAIARRHRLLHADVLRMLRRPPIPDTAIAAEPDEDL